MFLFFYFFFKVIANISINPALRKNIFDDKKACKILLKMSDVKNNGGDSLLARHSKIALDSVNWIA